jgi:hypothetical protein
MEPTKLTVGRTTVDVRNNCVYVEINGRTFYIEHNETTRMHVLSWVEGVEGTQVANFEDGE